MTRDQGGRGRKAAAEPPEKRNKNGTGQYKAGSSRHCRFGRPRGSDHQSDSAGTRRTATGSFVRGRRCERRPTHSDRTRRDSPGNSHTAMGLSTWRKKHGKRHPGHGRVLSPYDFWDHFNAQRSEGLDSGYWGNFGNQSLRIPAIPGSSQLPRIVELAKLSSASTQAPVAWVGVLQAALFSRGLSPSEILAFQPILGLPMADG